MIPLRQFLPDLAVGWAWVGPFPLEKNRRGTSEGREVRSPIGDNHRQFFFNMLDVVPQNVRRVHTTMLAAICDSNHFQSNTDDGSRPTNLGKSVLMILIFDFGGLVWHGVS